MQYFLRLLVLIGIVLAIIATIGSLLPRDYAFQSQTTINAPAANVFPLIDRLKDWQAWSQWDPERIESLTVSYSGPESGVGSTQSWTDERGDGKLWIVESVANERVDFRLTFAGFPEMSNSIGLAELDGKTRVTWSSEGTLPGGPFYGFFSPIFANGMQHQYDESLERLRNLAEEASVEQEASPAE